MKLNVPKHEEEISYDFELVLIDRDGQGKPTGKRNRIKSNNGSDLSDFLEHHEAVMESRKRQFKKQQAKQRRRRNKRSKNQ